MLWFHIMINDKGKILNFTITQANVDDREPLKKERFLDRIYGKLFANKGYIGKKLNADAICGWCTTNHFG